MWRTSLTFSYLEDLSLHVENFAIFFVLLWRRVVQLGGIAQRSFYVRGRRFRSDRKSGSSGRVTRPYRVSKQVQSHVVLAQQTLVRRRAEGRRRRCVRGESFSVRVDVAYLRALRRRFAPARVKSVPLPVPHAAQDIAGCVQRPYLPCVRSCRVKSTRPFSPYPHNYVS